MGKMNSIILVEDNKIIREGIKLLINATEDLKITKSFINGEELFKCISDFYDVKAFIVDIHLNSELTGIDVIKQLKLIYPKIPSIVFTVFEDSDYVYEALTSGAVGYLLKSSPQQKILESVRDAISGGSPMSSTIARKVVDFFKKLDSEKIINEVKNYNLSKRETEILDLLAKGYRYKEIAELLFISNDTVRTHIRIIYEKMGVRSKTEAVIKYLH